MKLRKSLFNLRRVRLVDGQAIGRVESGIPNLEDNQVLFLAEASIEVVVVDIPKFNVRNNEPLNIEKARRIPIVF